MIKKTKKKGELDEEDEFRIWSPYDSVNSHTR
jgi:hypothetical protein